MAKINHANKKDNECFQYTATVALNHEEIKNDLQRITKIKSLINKYNQEGINVSSEIDHWNKSVNNSFKLSY